MKLVPWLYVALFAVSLAPWQQAATAATKVFLLGGQSNMLGVGVASEIPTPFNAPQPKVRFWNNNQWVDLRSGFGYANYSFACFGPEVSFGYTLHKRVFPKDDIYLVKYAADGSNLAVDWNPDGTGPKYAAFKSMVDDAMTNLHDADRSPEIVGMIWMQGESDTRLYAADYAKNLKYFIEKVRKDFDSPPMRFVVGRITTFFPNDDKPSENNTLVRAAQETVPGQIGCASWIDTDNLDRTNLGFPDDRGHYGTRGQIDLGILFANEFTPRPTIPIRQR